MSSETQIDSPLATGSPGRGGEPFGVLVTAIVVSLSLVFSFIALTVNKPASRAEQALAGGAPVVLASLSEFSIDIADEIPLGAVIEARNDGAATHNLKLKEDNSTTPDLGAQETGLLDLTKLGEGTYTLFCDISGHEAAGMVKEITVSADAEVGAVTGGHDEERTPAEWAAMDQAMIDSLRAFPAASEGEGNQLLEFETMPDGTKQAEMTAKIVEWETEPGRIVKAWTYNGMVPGPMIQVDVGDKIRIIVHNELPSGTDVHWHGITTPFAMDGVAPFSQELIGSGEDFVYEFEALEPSVGMYHSHHMGHTQVPNGMLGVFNIGEMPIPRGQIVSGELVPEDLVVSQRIPMVLNDAGVIGYSLNGKGFPATAPITAAPGEWIRVDYFNEGLQIHPMHLHQFDQIVIAKDGEQLDSPYRADTINVAPGERFSVLVHAKDAGTWVWHCHILTHVERDAGMFGMVTALVVG